ncbi:SapB/AmfS family lanthipeptide, partial [Streptomyces sp. NPDC029216]|uniref:SapB/AmfS family lanthipeptide n=1 Tax=Streptomyces sp. NPDC029216 TaxID=3154701 RepID=UPI0033C8F03F
MTLLDLQSMETPKEETTEAAQLTGSRASLLLCGDSSPGEVREGIRVLRPERRQADRAGTGVPYLYVGE